jgi:hypothetical protein
MLVAQRQRVVKIDLSEANSSMVLPLIGVEVKFKTLLFTIGYSVVDRKLFVQILLF